MPARIADRTAPYARIPRVFAALRLWLGFLFLLSATACSRTPEPPRAIGLLAWDRIELTADSAEPIRAIPVREGEQVAAGTSLVQLDTERATARVAQTRAERERAAAALAELRRGPRRERIATGRARLEGAFAALRLAELELRRQQELVRQRLAPQAALDRAVAQQRQARAERNVAAEQLAELERGSTDEERLQAERTLARTAAAEREAQVALDRLNVRAPGPGRVDALPFEVGEQPAVGAVVAVLLVGDAPYARVYVPEPLRSRVAPGSRALVHVDGRGRPFPGTVRRVSADPVFTPYYALTDYDRRHLSYLAEVVLDQAPALPAGVPVEVEFAPTP